MHDTHRLVSFQPSELLVRPELAPVSFGAILASVYRF